MILEPLAHMHGWYGHTSMHATVFLLLCRLAIPRKVLAFTCPSQ